MERAPRALLSIALQLNLGVDMTGLRIRRERAHSRLGDPGAAGACTGRITPSRVLAQSSLDATTPDHDYAMGHQWVAAGSNSCITAHRNPTSSRATATTAICGRFRYDRWLNR